MIQETIWLLALTWIAIIALPILDHYQRKAFKKMADASIEEMDNLYRQFLNDLKKATKDRSKQ